VNSVAIYPDGGGNGGEVTPRRENPKNKNNLGVYFFKK